MTENTTENDNVISEAGLVELIVELAMGIQLINAISGDDQYGRGYAAGATEVLKVLAEKGPSLRVQQ